MMRFYKNLDKYTNKYIDLVGTKFDTVEELESEIALIIAETVNKNHNKSDSVIFHSISININRILESMRKSVYEKDEFETLDKVDECKYISYENIENAIVVKELIEKLSMFHPSYRDILTKYYFKNDTLKEIAKDYDLSPTRIADLRDRALNATRKPAILKTVDPNYEAYYSRKAIEDIKNRNNKLSKENQQIETIARALTESYITLEDNFDIVEIRIHHMTKTFESKLRTKVRDYIEDVKEKYNDNRVTKINFIQLINNDYSTNFQFICNTDLNRLFRDCMYRYEDAVKEDLEILLTEKRIKL